MLNDMQMAALREAFVAEAIEHLDDLESALLDLKGRPDDPELVNRSFRALHSIKGSGSMFGYDEMSTFVHEIETVFDRVRKGRMTLSGEVIALTLQAKDELRIMIGREGSQPVVREAATAAILDQFHRLIDSPDTPKPEEKPEKKRYRISFSPPPDLMKRGTDPVMLLDELRSLGTCRIVADTSRVPDLDTIVPDLCYLSWRIEIETAAPREEIAGVFEFVAESSEISIEETRPASDGPASGVPSSDIPAAGEDASRTIRVPSQRLDSLVDLIGELVTVQARLSDHVIENGDAAFTAISEEIERLTGELRDTAMGLRMVPIRNTFTRLRRLIHDLSSRLGKEIRLTTEGVETELDKTVIERLGDPLMHLIRNAIDHGIEDASERHDTGKDPIGTIALRAVHEGATVVISVSDDGRGLDPVAIRNRAVERGVIDTDSHLSDAQIRELIFAPGFSTATEVTGVSGRGVGMDVVRQTINTLGGEIEVASDIGAGTTISLRLPLTLAIIDGLLVRVGDQHYVLPLGAVRELIEYRPARTGHGGPLQLMDVRGARLPVVNLQNLFDGCSDTAGRGHVVIVHWDGTIIGLLVSEVKGRQQTVIKSLGALPERVEGVSGATILGDGSVALILDLPKLLADIETGQRETTVEAV